MAQPLITCNCCNGKGRKNLPKELNESFIILAAIVERDKSSTVAMFSREAHVELTAAHHRIKRMVNLGVVKRVKGKSPAEYVTA